MKQAILITAYKNIPHLLRIINHFDENFSFYIHIDKKNQLTQQEIQTLNQHPKIAGFSQAFITHWGSTAHLHSILHLIQKAIQAPEIEYLHLISGHDYPIQSTSYFQKFMQQNKGREFIEYFPLPTHVWENGGLDRLKYFHLHNLINAKGKFGHWIHRFIKLQKKLRFSRNLDFKGMALHGGSTWWSISRQAATYTLNFLKQNPWFLKKFRYSFCAEEMLIQTILLNSPFKHKIQNNNLRYIVWEFRNGNIPAVLDESDLESIQKSNHLFARRFDYPASEKLLEKLV